MLSPEKLWNEFINLDGGSNFKENQFTAWCFCDNENCANALLELVLEGKKCATSSALWTYENEGESIPAIGDLSILTKWNGHAECIIRTTNIEIIPFNKVDKGFAVLEGEGNKSLEEWRNVHWEFFTRELLTYGKFPVKDMPVVCETFEVIYRSGA